MFSLHVKSPPVLERGIKSPFGFCETHTLQHVGVIVLPQHFANDIQSQREKGIGARVHRQKSHHLANCATMPPNLNSF